MATTTSLGPFSTNAEGCTIADLLDPWMARASMAVAANQDQSGGQFLLLRPVIMRGGLASGHHHMAEQWISSLGDILPVHREGWSGRQLLCFWQSHASVSRGSYVGNACGRARASFRGRSSCVHVSKPYNKMVSIQVWYRRSFVCSWSPVCRQTLFIERMAVEAMPIAPDNVWLTPARNKLNRPQIMPNWFQSYVVCWALLVNGWQRWYWLYDRIYT